MVHITHTHRKRHALIVSQPTVVGSVEMLSKSAERNFFALQDGVARYRENLSFAERKEWDVVWGGLDSHGHFLTDTQEEDTSFPRNHTMVNAVQSLLKHCEKQKNGKSVMNALLSELHDLHQSLQEENDRFESEYLTDSAKN